MYVDFSGAYKQYIYKDKYITGKIFTTNLSREISITGYDRENNLRQETIVNNWKNHIQYLRLATPEEEEQNYYMQEDSKKYNL